MKTLILGLGNPIISDDSVGFKVAEQLEERLCGRNDVVVSATSLSGLNLLDATAGYERVIVVDSIQTQGGRPGAIYRLEPGDFEMARHSATLHDVGLLSALELGRRLGLHMPREVILFAIEAEDVTSFSEQCTPQVAKAVPLAVDMVLKEVKNDKISPTATESGTD